MTNCEQIDILVVIKLGQFTLLSKLYLLSEVPDIRRIYVVRDSPGPAVPKVVYYCPPSPLRNISVASAAWKLGLLTLLGLSKRPHLVHGFLLKPHGYLAFLAAKLTGKKASVSLIAGQFELYEDTHGRLLNPNIRRKFLRRMVLAVLRRCELITCTGSSTRRSLIAAGIPEHKVHVVHHAVVGPTFDLSKPPWCIDLLYVGRLAPDKHVEVFLNVLAALRSQGYGLRGAIVGDGPERQRLAAHAQELGLVPHVTFAGHQTDIAGYYASSRIMLFPSAHEGFPMVFVEALHSGLPSIVTKCGDITDIAKDEVNCLLVDDWTCTEQFVDAARRLLDDQALWERLSRGSRDSAAGVSVARVVEQWSSAIRSTLGAKPGASE